jgi:hypothetical protein
VCGRRQIARCGRRCRVKSILTLFQSAMYEFDVTNKVNVPGRRDA